MHSRAPSGPPGSFGCVRYIPMCTEARRSVPVRPGCSRVRSWAFGPFPCALRVVRFVRMLSLHSCAPCGFIRFRSVHSCAPRGSSGSFRCVRFIPRPRRFHSGALGPFPSSLGSSGSFGFVQSIPVRTGGRWVHSGSLGPFICILGSFDAFLCVLGVFGFIRVRSVHFSALWG